MNNERRTRAESTRTHGRSQMSSQNGHPHTNRDVKHPAGHQPPAKGSHRDEPSYGKKVSREEVNEDFKTILKSSDRFANNYGEENTPDEVKDFEKLSLKPSLN